MRSIDRDELGSVPILLSEHGFPGELTETDTSRARQLIQTSDVDAVVLAAGDGVFWWVEAVGEQAVSLVGAGTAGAVDGFALGTGDGATLPGVPVDWDLLTFVCPHGDTTLLLPQYPAPLPTCPAHDVPLDLVDDSP